MAKTTTGNAKVKGQVVAEYEGLTISVLLQKAKRAGKDRLWVQIRQNSKKKRWSMYESLNYPYGVDVQFVADPGKDSSK